MKMRISFVGALVVASAFVAYAETYFIDFDKGNDTADGTSRETAWKTLPGTRKSDNSDWVSLRYGNGVVQRWVKTVQPGTTFLVKSGSHMGSPDTGRLWIEQTFYANGTPEQPIRIQRDTAWGSGQIQINGTTVAVPRYHGLVEIEGIDCVQLDGAVTNGIRIANSACANLRLADRGYNGSHLKNVELYNASNANLIVQSIDSATPRRIGGVVVDTVTAHVTNFKDDTAANFYISYAENIVIRNCVAYDSADESDGIHLGGTRNAWILNCVTHDNGEQGIDISRDGDYKSRDDDYNITVRDCVSYNNYKQNFDLNSGVHHVYWIGCVGWKTRIQESGDGNFDVYQGTQGENYWINCTSGRGQDFGYGFQWNGALSVDLAGIPAGIYHQYLINCLSHADVGCSVVVEPDFSNRVFQVHYINSLFTSSNKGIVVREKEVGYRAADIQAASNGWFGTACLAVDPQFAVVADAWPQSDLRPRGGSPCSEKGVFPFTAALTTNAAVLLDLVPVVSSLDVRRIFLPGDRIAIEGVGSVVVAACDTATRIRLASPCSWVRGSGVWFPWNGKQLQIGAGKPLALINPPDNLRPVIVPTP